MAQHWNSEPTFECVQSSKETQQLPTLLTTKTTINANTVTAV